MRAIIMCGTTTKDVELEEILTKLNWWPNLPQNSNEVEVNKKEIIQLIPDSDRVIVEKTFICTVYDAETRTWGIINRPNQNRLIFRLKNPVSDRLKHSCEKLVNKLRSYSTDHKNNFCFKFKPRVEVLEPGNDNFSFSGEILPSSRVQLAIQERKTEVYVGIFAGLTAIILLIITSPLVSNFVLPSPTSSWRIWTSGTLERFSTAALVTATISFFEVALHWFDIRRKSIIRWVLE